MADPGDSSVKPEDFLAPLKQYVPERRRTGEKDLLGGRYRILNQPLPEFSSSYAKAVAVQDEKAPETSLYALIYEPGAPLRQKNINALKTFRHPALVSLLADGLVEHGPSAETRYAVVLDKPAGQALSQILARRGEPMSESLILPQFLRPLAEILLAFVKMGISHNHIHLGNIYLQGSHMMVGECFSGPSGFSQDFMFEPIERLMTSARAKADFAPEDDCYALAILALHLALGAKAFPKMTKETLIRDILSKGAYHTLVMPHDLPESLQDLFRGVFNDGRRERWDINTIDSWLSGRRFNLILPRAPQETTKGFEFAGKSHPNRKMLAYHLWQEWKEAKSVLNDNRLARWLTIQLHKSDTAEAIMRVAMPGASLTPQQKNEALSRIITLLDPSGPLRYKQIATTIDGIGALFAHALVAERHDEVKSLRQIIESDLPGAWIEQQKSTPEYVALAAKLQKARNHLRMKGPGFGIERCLYDLNPTLPCLSPLLKGYTVMNLADLLAALDAIAPQKGANEEIGDAHITAFIASRLEITREIKLNELHSLPALANHPVLIMLKLLAQAQGKTGETAFKGLSLWLAVRLLPLLAGMRSRVRQQKLRASLRTAANQGSLQTLAELILSPQAFEADMRDFQKASAEYAALKQHIAALKSNAGLALHASQQGRGVAQSIAYSVCLATVYLTLKTCFHL